MAQARKAGPSDAEVRRLRREEWAVLRRGVYVKRSLLAEATGDVERRHALDVAALLLVLQRPAVAVSTSAVRVLGLEFLNAPAD